MTENQKAAYIIAQSVAAYANIEGMKAHNQHQLAIGETMLYDEKAFAEVPQIFGINSDQVITLFHN